MKRIKQSKEKWPRYAVKSVECRKRDLVIRISNWMRDKDEPAFDVECYIGGIYDFNESKSFTRSSGLSVNECKLEAIKFANEQIVKLL